MSECTVITLYTEQKRVLVTEVRFIGSHLCERLLADGHEVICLDNLFTGTKGNVSHLLQQDRFEFIRHDIHGPSFGSGLDIHLACPASPIHYQYNPVKTTKVNVLGALNMLGLAKRVRARIFQASTSEVYGDPEIHPQNELYWGHVNPVGRRSCYDEGKRVAETLFFDYMRQNSVDIKVAVSSTPMDHECVQMMPGGDQFCRTGIVGEPITYMAVGTRRDLSLLSMI